MDLLTKHINQLLDGEEIDVPSYNFITGKREYHGHKLKIGEKDVLVMEGIHGLMVLLRMKYQKMQNIESMSVH